jgi:hypothetical protein
MNHSADSSPATRQTSASFYWFLFFLIVFSVQTIPNLYMDSKVSDEDVDIFTGYRCWSGEILLDPTHPPMAKAVETLPLLGMKINPEISPKAPNIWTKAFCFFFVSNPGRAEAIVEAARWVNLVLFGWGMGWLLFLITRKWPVPAFITTMTLWTFDPLFLAYSPLSKADLPVTFLFLATLVVNQKSRENPSLPMDLLTGFLSGLCITSKFTGLALVAIVPLLDFFQRPTGSWFSKPALLRLGEKWFLNASGAITAIALVYLPASFHEPDHLEPLHYFLNSISQRIIIYPPIYFEGALTGQKHWLYYPILLLLKTPIPLLLLGALGYFLIAFKKINPPLWQWLPGPFFFIALLPMQNNGIRNALPSFPFFILVAAQAAGFLWNWRSPAAPSAGKIAVGGLLLFQVFSVAFGPSHPLSYANELLPRNQKIYWLGSTDLDAGQDTKSMSLFAQKQRWDHVKLAYIGLDDPQSYGLNWNYWTEADLKTPQPGWVYLVNVEFLQLGSAFNPQSRPLFNSWLTRTPPTGEIGDTWYYFDVPGPVKAKDNSKIIISAALFNYLRDFYSSR